MAKAVQSCFVKKLLRKLSENLQKIARGVVLF